MSTATLMGAWRAFCESDEFRGAHKGSLWEAFVAGYTAGAEARIMSATDEEVCAQIRAEGGNPEEVAASVARIIDSAIAKHRTTALKAGG